MPKIRRKSIENDFLLIFFYIQSKGAAQSSILMILRHPLVLYITATIVVCQEQANIPPVKNKTDWLIPADGPHT